MRSISSKLIALSAALLSSLALAQNSQLPKYTVATLPAATSYPTYIVEVVDGTTPTDCTTGGATGTAAYNVACESHGGAWVAVGAPASAYDAAGAASTAQANAIASSAQKSANLSDLTSAATARTNLGLGSMAQQAASAVAVTGGTVNGVTIGATTAEPGTFTAVNITAANCAAQTTVTTPCSIYSGSGFAATSSGSSVSLASPAVNAVYQVCGWVFPHNTSGTAGNAQTVITFTSPAGTSQSNTQISLPYSVTYNDAACKAVPVKASTTPTVQAIDTVTGGTFNFDWMITVTRTQ